MVFGYLFDQPVIIPSSLKKLAFYANTYSHPIDFPAGLGELEWYADGYEGLVLPERLQKLTWGSTSDVKIPTGLKELAVECNTLLVLPEELVTVAFGYSSQHHYTLPASVQEVSWVIRSNKNIFTHPSTLQHLMVKYSASDVGLDLSNHTIHKLTIVDRQIRIEKWPQGLKELAFSARVDGMNNPLRVPKGCRIVGEKRPENVIME